MNLLNDVYIYEPDLDGNRELPEDERVRWHIQPPTVAQVQQFQSDDRRAEFFQHLLDEHFVRIENMCIAGETVTTVAEMEDCAREHLNPRQNRRLQEELVSAVRAACFLTESEKKK